MVDRRTDYLVMEVKIHYDDMKRVTTRENNYFYTAIDETPFRYYQMSFAYFDSEDSSNSTT